MFGWIWLDPLLFALEIREGSILVFRKSPYKICNLGHFSIAIFEKQDINRFRRNSDVRSFQRADFIFFQTYLASLRPTDTYYGIYCFSSRFVSSFILEHRISLFVCYFLSQYFIAHHCTVTSQSSFVAVSCGICDRFGIRMCAFKYIVFSFMLLTSMHL